MRTFSRYLTLVVGFGTAFAVAASGCTGIVGDLTFDRPEGAGGATSSGTTASGGATSSNGSSTSTSSAGTGGATSSASSTSSSSAGTGGGSTCPDPLCDPMATCSDTSGHAVCTCPKDLHDVHGDGTKCVDPCLPGSCSSHGACTHAMGVAVCACDAGWTGDACDKCVYFVDGAASGAQDGTSWTNAFTSLQSALNAAGAKATAAATTCDVWVKAGTYHVYATSAGDTIALRSSVGLYGGFAGTETQRGDAVPLANLTILSGEKMASGPKVSHVVTALDVSGAVIDGFTIQDGSANGATLGDGQGGGVLIASQQKATNATVSRCTVTANAGDGAGGIGMAPGSLPVAVSVVGCDVHDNTGGLFCNGMCTVTGTTFRANSAKLGGGIYAHDSILVATGDSFLDNVSAGDGGGILLEGSSLGTTLSQLVFSGNRVITGVGGGIHIKGGNNTTTITNSLFVGNVASGAGGGIADESAGLTCINCTITGNQGGGNGDGLVTLGMGATLINSIVWGNPGLIVPMALEVNKTMSTSHCDVRGGASGTTFDTDPLFVSMPRLFDRVAAPSGATTSVVVSFGALYAPGDMLEIGGDGVARKVTSVVTNTVTFMPALAVAATTATQVRDWGALSTPLPTLDAHLKMASMGIDYADPVTAPPVDLAGKTRGPMPDIGAYETP